MPNPPGSPLGTATPVLGGEHVGTPWSDRVLGRLARVTTSGAFISEIDGLRFIAIGTVILFHLMTNLQAKAPAAYTPPPDGALIGVLRQGFHGVELFFVISGFILALPFATHHLRGGKPVRLRDYFVRRVTRLEPPYILCMLGLFAAALIVKGASAAALGPHLVASLLYLHNAVFASESPVNNVAWSLEVEIQFYLLVPLLSTLFAVRHAAARRTLLLVVIAVSVLLGWRFIEPGDRLYLSIFRFLHFFLLGFFLADVYLTSWGRRPPKSLAWDLVSVIGWPVLFAVWNIAPGGHDGLLARAFFPPAALALYAAAFRGRLTNAVLTNRWITAVGGMCYSIYLLHNPLLGLVLRLTSYWVPTGAYGLDYGLQAAIAIPIVLVPCALYFVAIEKPCMRRDWPARLAGWLRTAVQAGRA